MNQNNTHAHRIQAISAQQIAKTITVAPPTTKRSLLRHPRVERAGQYTPKMTTKQSEAYEFQKKPKNQHQKIHGLYGFLCGPELLEV